MVRCLCQRTLARRSRRRRFGSSSSSQWDGMGLSKEMLSALKAVGYNKPTFVQDKVIPEAIKGTNVLFAAQTGTGKTLSYLVPMIEHLRSDEAAGKELRERRPRALVFVPNRELAHQVLGVAKGLSHHVRFSSGAFTGGQHNKRYTRSRLERGVDVAVCTPDRAQQLVERGEMLLSDVRYVTLDEADTLVDESNGFGPLVGSILDDLRKRRMLPKEYQDPAEYDPEAPKAKPLQFYFASATMRRGSEDLITNLAPQVKVIEGMNLGRLIPRLERSFRYVKGDEDKMLILTNLLRRHDNQNGILVFCNTITSAQAVRFHLLEQGLEVAAYHGDMKPEDRLAAYSSFAEGKVGVLVATDIAARGLDTTFVDHVILFDFPKTAEDYLHRVGRAARAGRKGRLTSLVTKKGSYLAKAIETLAERGIPINQDTLAAVDAKLARHGGQSINAKKRSRKTNAGSGTGGARKGGDAPRISRAEADTMARKAAAKKRSSMPRSKEEARLLKQLGRRAAKHG